MKISDNMASNGDTGVTKSTAKVVSSSTADSGDSSDVMSSSKNCPDDGDDDSSYSVPGEEIFDDFESNADKARRGKVDYESSKGVGKLYGDDAETDESVSKANKSPMLAELEARNESVGKVRNVVLLAIVMISVGVSVGTYAFLSDWEQREQQQHSEDGQPQAGAFNNAGSVEVSPYLRGGDDSVNFFAALDSY